MELTKIKKRFLKKMGLDILFIICTMILTFLGLSIIVSIPIKVYQNIFYYIRPSLIIIGGVLFLFLIYRGILLNWKTSRLEIENE